MNEKLPETFEEWALEWLETYKKGFVKQHTYMYTYEVNLKKYLIPYFGKMELSKIKQIDIQRYFNSANLDGRPFSKSVLHKHKVILTELFASAVANDLCNKNPVVGIHFKNVAEEEERPVYTLEQAELVENYAKEHHFYGIVIMLETGIRRSELLGLQWTDIDFSNLWIHIQRGVTPTKGGILIDKPKTKESNRKIPISEEFAEYLHTLPYEGKFVIGTNKPKSPNTYAKQFRNFMKQVHEDLGVPILTPHELRHTFGTLLYEKGIDMYSIQKLMGHSNVLVTSSVYVHNDISVLRQKMGLTRTDKKQ